MVKTPLTKNRIVLALAVTALADAVQFPITDVEATSAFESHWLLKF